jgi:hypothetical protein
MNSQILRNDGPRLPKRCQSEKSGGDKLDYDACLPVKLSETKEGSRGMMVHMEEG